MTRAVSEVLDALEASGAGERVTVRALVEGLGDRSFAALLLVPGLLMVSPVSGIPGAPTAAAAIVALIVVQMLAGRRSLWLPRLLAERSLPARRLRGAVAMLRPPVGRVERLMRPRLGWLARRPWSHLALGACLAVTLTVPLMEVLPFLATTAGLAISLLAAGLLVRDGAVMLAGYGVILAGVLLGAALMG